MSSTPALVLAGCILTVGSIMIVSESDFRPVGDHSGYEPTQPIEFSHRLHAGELAMDCLACHYGAERSRHAGIPSASVCMGCHRQVTAGSDATTSERLAAKRDGREPKRIISPKLRVLYETLGLDDNLDPVPGVEPRPIQWIRVHDLPDYAAFDHRVHVARGLACQQCHGPVQTMERVRQEASLSMGWCMDCHRSSPVRADSAPPSSEDPRGEHVSTDCARCHY